MQTKNRDLHQLEVEAFLQTNLAVRKWQIRHPSHGTGQETYITTNGDNAYFIKLNANIERYKIMSALGFAPQVIAAGFLEDGISILVQIYIEGKSPTRSVFQAQLEQFATIIRETHQNNDLILGLPQKSNTSHRAAAFDAISQVEKRWRKIKNLVPASTKFVDQSIAFLTDRAGELSTDGLVASHNDINNSNWLVSGDSRIYLLDLESMSLDDPALDLGAILWWYYPPEMRQEFLEVCGYSEDEDFHNRMRIRMAIHNLNIILPRENSFDSFSPKLFEEKLTDFRAIMEGKENPQGYND